MTVVEDLDVVEDRVRQIEPSSPRLSVQQFDLHRRPTRFHHRVVVPATDRPERILLVNARDVNSCSVIGVHEPAGRRFSILDRHIQDIHYQGRVLAVIDRPTDDLPAERV